MLLRELFEDTKKPDLIEIFRKFFPLAMKEIGLKDLPEIELVDRVQDRVQPTFGKFVNDTNTIYLGILNRHPLDILRTLAHELVHYKQNIEHRLDATSGHTGSPAENEAHEIAGIVMRHFNKMHPEYFDDLPIMTEGWRDDLKKRSRQVGLGLTAAAGFIGGLKSHDYFYPPYQYTQQQAQDTQDEPLIPSDDNDDYYQGPTSVDKNQGPEIEVPKIPKAEIPTVKEPELQTPLKQSYLKKYIQAQKMVKLPNDLENNLKNSAMKQGIVGLELDQFLGQWAHESGNFTQFDEMYRNGEAFKSKKWFIDHYWKNERIRKALGNKHPNDAWMYRGRGFCQLTGRGNYEQAGKALGIDLANKPNLAANPKYMESIAIWYWKNRVATKVDAEHMGDTTAVSRAINHGESKENIQKRHTWVQWFRNVFGRGA